MQLIEAWERLRAHWADQHPDHLPDFQTGCANCLEWRATLTDPAHRPGTISYAVLARERTLHRAGHLFSPR